MRYQPLIAVIALAYMVDAAPAYAYLDPGTGSLLLQGIIGGVAATIGIVTLQYARLKAWLSRVFGRSGSDQNN